MLASKNTRPAVNTPAQGMHWIGVLGGELNVRLRDAREINPGLWPKTLVLGTRTGMSSPLYSFSLTHIRPFTGEKLTSRNRSRSV